jgi:hypothetical protein
VWERREGEVVEAGERGGYIHRLDIKRTMAGVRRIQRGVQSALILVVALALVVVVVVVPWWRWWK